MRSIPPLQSISAPGVGVVWNRVWNKWVNLITDHNVRETLRITDRGYILNDGQILAAGRTEELYNDPLVREYYLGQDFQW